MIRLKRLYANDFKQLQELALTFPDAGRILVQGRNEAGKSTLFEAVFFALFGQALLTETGSRGLADLVGYGHERCRVELDVQIRDTLFKIERGVRVTKKRDKNTGAEKENALQTVSLTILRAEDEERVEGINTVNERLERELGFDAETLLNTCFVEQKKLDKLETTARKDREHALAKLLNLDALVELENDLEISREDRDTLQRLEMRRQLAQAQAELPPVEEELAQVERALNLAELKRQLEQGASQARAMTALDAELGELRPRARELTARAERALQLRDALSEIRNAVSALETNAQQREQLEHERAEAAERERADHEALPRLEQRVGELRSLVQRAKRLERIETLRDASEKQINEWNANLAQLQNDRAHTSEIEKQAESERARLTDTDARLRDYQRGAALDAWVEATSASTPNGAAPQELEAKRRARQQLDSRARRDLIALGTVVILGGGLAFAALLIPILARFDLIPALLISAILLLVTLLLGGFLIWRTVQDYRALARTAEEIGRLEKQDEASSVVRRAAQERIEKANAQFVALGMPTPRDLSFAQAQRVELAGRLAEKSQDELTRAREEAQVNLKTFERELGELQERTSEAQLNALNANLAACAKVKTRAERLLTNYRGGLGEQSRTEVERALDRTQLELSELRKRQTTISQQTAQFDSRAQMLAASRGQVRETLVRAEQLSEIRAPAFDESLTGDTLRGYGKQAQEEFQRLGGPKANDEAKQANAQVAAKEGELKANTRALDNLWQAARELATRLKVEYSPGPLPSAEALEQWANGLDAPSVDEHEQYDRRAKKLREARGRLRGTLEQLDEKLALGGEFLNEVEAKTAYEKFARELQVRQRAVEIAETARRRVMQKVLPATMDYMRRLLPQLTRERYHDAELDPESYKIKVWDERGQLWKEKNIFSGGTKDQFSLALRLAFALATLPQERNTAPGFIFLDEPLGSFDDERADALLDLLTEGEVAHAFDQIFLISHVRVREDRFTHRVVLENGRVVESNLPTGEPQEESKQ